jgi:hypothetical protein
MFHVKHFGTIGGLRKCTLQSAAKCGAGIWIKQTIAIGSTL